MASLYLSARDEKARYTSAIQSGLTPPKRASITKIASICRIANSTLKDYINKDIHTFVDIVGRQHAKGNRRFSNEIERQLVDWAIRRADACMPVNSLACRLRLWRYEQEAEKASDDQFQIPSQRYFRGLLDRYPEISLRHSELVSSARLHAGSAELHFAWFKLYFELLVRVFGSVEATKPDRLFAFDEIGWQCTTALSDTFVIPRLILICMYVLRSHVFV